MKARTAGVFITAILVSISVSSCSGGGGKAQEKPSDVSNEEETPSLEAVCPATGESENPAIFTYEDAKKSLELPTEILLHLHDEPVNVPEKGFVKFEGVAVGAGEVALIEIGGVGEVVRAGDFIGGYVIKRIGTDEMVLVRNDAVAEND